MRLFLHGIIGIIGAASRDKSGALQLTWHSLARCLVLEAARIFRSAADGGEREKCGSRIRPRSANKQTRTLVRAGRIRPKGAVLNGRLDLTIIAHVKEL